MNLTMGDQKTIIHRLVMMRNPNYHSYFSGHIWKENGLNGFDPPRIINDFAHCANLLPLLKDNVYV